MDMRSGDVRVLGDGDASMMEVNDKGRPPSEPPDSNGSWASKVSGTSAGGRPVPEMVVAEEFVAERVSVEFPNGEDGEAVITIGKEMLDAMNGMWKNCMIVKVLGRNVPIAVLSRKLREMWKPKGTLYVLDLPRQFFMVRFGDEEEYLAALTGGPWKAFGSYLMVQEWSPDFEPTRDDIVTTPVWVRLSHLPVNFYHKTILMSIAKGVGKPLRVDANFERARFARVCVEVDLRKPLKGSVLVNGERYYVAYEGLTNICSLCGVYGHLTQNCPKGAPVQAVERPVGEGEGRATVNQGEEDGFTVVLRSERRVGLPARSVTAAAGGVRRGPGPNLREIPKNKEIALTNVFGRLDVDIASPELREVAIIQGPNKENENIMINHNNGNRFMSSKEGVSEGIFKSVRGSNKGGGKEIRAQQAKKSEVNGPRGKGKQNKPTNGLIFGSQRQETELSSSGKRLRMESAGVGRPGGVFVLGKGVDVQSVTVDKNPVIDPTGTYSGSKNEQRRDDGVDEVPPSDVTMGLVAA